MSLKEKKTVQKTVGDSETKNVGGSSELKNVSFIISPQSGQFKNAN